MVYTRREEIANASTHALGFLLSIAALTLLVVFAAMRGSAWHVVACSVFGASLVILYASSTIYHGLHASPAKRFFGFMDHSAIFLLIAGTYTPFTLAAIRGALGWTVFGIIWGLAILGIISEFVSRGRLRKPALIAYLVMGWMIMAVLVPLIHAVSPGGLWLLFGGGLFYSLGVVFFLWHSLPYHHAIWHLFVLGGSACHVFSVLWFVIPPAAG